MNDSRRAPGNETQRVDPAQESGAETPARHDAEDAEREAPRDPRQDPGPDAAPEAPRRDPPPEREPVAAPDAIREPAAKVDARVARNGFRADLPLAILESVRQHDRPAEVLEDEDLMASLPRRLGLTGVVDSQIHRYRIARRRRERISAEEVADLLRLVMRRPDCEPIFRAAGHELARAHGRKPIVRLTALARVLPDALSRRAAVRSLRRLLRRIGGGVHVAITRKPFRISMDHPVTAQVDPYGMACILYSAAIEEAVHQVTGRPARVDHSACQSRGDAEAVWEVDF